MKKTNRLSEAMQRIAAIRIIASIAMMAVIGFTMAACSSPSGGGGDTVINIAGIAGVTPPATGETPVTTITQTAQYTGTVSWSPSPVTFAASTTYTATITLTAKPGFTLQGVAANFFTVAGATTVSNSADSGVVTAVFPTTGATPPTAINIAAIPGVTAPVTGATPKTAITETAQYTGTIAWSGSPVTFAASTAYTATITLTAKPGYTLTGVAANFFTVAGATPSNSINSGVVTAVFPATGAAAYNIGDPGPGGGIVFYDKGSYSDGWQYLEAAPVNAAASSITWSSTNVNVTGATGTAIGTGKANTAAIIAAHPGDTLSNNAAWACVDYRGPNNLTDWFLPSKDELNEMYNARTYLGISPDYFFSSSQYISGSAWLQYFDNGSQYAFNKLNDYHVRAVRAF